MLQQASLPAERRFFLAMTLLLLGTVVLGFSRTLYLRPWFPERVAGTATEAIYLWHGAACSAWIALLAVQVWLISQRAVSRHRQLGWLGVALIGLVAVTGWMAARTAALRPGGFIGVPLPPEHFLIVPLGDLAFFTVLTALGITARRQPASHKRLMLMGTVPMVDAAIFRWPFDFASASPPFEPVARVVSYSDLVLLLYLVPFLWCDWRHLGRIHTVTAGVSVALAAYVVLRMPIGGTAAWQALARSLLGA
jgi:hypothetical protein